MKLGAKESAAFLRAPHKDTMAVLLYGPDGGLVRERARLIASLVLGKNSDPLNLIELSHDQLKADPVLLRDELSALSLMGGPRVITVQGATDKIAGAFSDALEDINPTAYLVVEAGELGASSPLRKLFEGGAKLASLACYRDEGRNLEDTIRTTLAALGKHASSEAMQYLTAHLGNDRGVTHSELEKIALYLGDEKEVTLETARLLTDHNASESLDDLCHAVAGGKSAEVESLLAQLLHEGTQPVAIMRALIRHFQRLDIAAAHMSSGMPASQAIGQLRPMVFFKYVPLMSRELSLWRARSLSNVLNLFLRTEKELKSSTLSPALLTGHALQQATRMAA